MTNEEVKNITLESLRDWFKKEKWVRISSSGNIAGKCGTSKNKKNPDRCLPKAKAQSLTKGQRAATAAKKKKAGSKGKTVVKNTKKATVKKEAQSHPVMIQQRIAHAKKAKEKEKVKKETKEAPAGHYFTKSGNLVKGRMSKDAKERGARKSDPKDKMRSKVPKATQYTETADPQDGKSAPYGSGFKPITKEAADALLEKCWKGYEKKGMKTMFGKKVPNCVKKEDIQNLVVGLLHEVQNEGAIEEKDDRCTRLAKSKYDTWPSAYASGAVVRCRRGDIWKKK